MNLTSQTISYPVPDEDFLFVSSAMSYRADRNLPAIREALATLRGAGYVAWSPYQSFRIEDEFPQRGILADVAAVADDRCTGVVVLPDWENGIGSKLEVLMAAKLDKPVYHYDAELIGVFSLWYFRFIPKLA